MPNNPTGSGLADNRPEDYLALPSQKVHITAKWRYGRESKHLMNYKTANMENYFPAVSYENKSINSVIQVLRRRGARVICKLRNLECTSLLKHEQTGRQQHNMH